MLEQIDRFVKKNRAVSTHNFLSKTFKTVEFDGEWKDCIGLRVCLNGIWIMWGHSGNGKTSGSLKLAEYLTKFEKVLYDSLEEGARMTMQMAMNDAGMKKASRRFTLLDAESFEDLKKRMRLRKCPRVIIIDSLQFAGITKKQYIQFKQEFADQYLIIFISHCEGKQPEGKLAKFVRYDADVKLFVEGHTIYPTSRYRGKKPLQINPELSNKFNELPA